VFRVGDWQECRRNTSCLVVAWIGSPIKSVMTPSVTRSSHFRLQSLEKSTSGRTPGSSLRSRHDPSNHSGHPRLDRGSNPPCQIKRSQCVRASAGM